MPDFQQTLTRLKVNLQVLREREAKYGINAPVELLNQIEDHKQAITLTEQVQSGDLTEADWQEAMRPLLVNIPQSDAVNRLGIRQSSLEKFTLRRLKKEGIEASTKFTLPCNIPRLRSVPLASNELSIHSQWGIPFKS